MTIFDVETNEDYVKYMNRISDCVLHINGGRYVFEMNDFVINPFQLCKHLKVDINKFKEVCKNIPTGRNATFIIVSGKKKMKIVVESYPRFWSNEFLGIVYYK